MLAYYRHLLRHFKKCKKYNVLRTKRLLKMGYKSTLLTNNNMENTVNTFMWTANEWLYIANLLSGLFLLFNSKDLHELGSFMIIF